MRGALVGGLLFVAGLAVGATGGEPAGSARLTVSGEPVTVGDPLDATLTLDLSEGASFDPVPLGAEIGPFTVKGGSWSAPQEGGQPGRWVWTGKLVAFRTGELTIPPVRLRVASGGGSQSVSTEPVAVVIESVLDTDSDAAEEAELADLKAPASLEPRYGPLWAALGGLALLLASAGLLWWLHRRYAARLTAVPAPEDPFQRTPPHVWIFGELQSLLARRLPEQGQVDLFYEELSRILKVYLGGRFRVELLEHTTEEIPDRLRLAGTEASAVDEVLVLLEECDRVKFARHRPAAEACRDAVERIYRIVDITKPADAPPAVVRPGAA